MTWHPTYKLYASDGLTLVYSFDFITNDNSPQNPFNQTEIMGFRGQGSLIIPGSIASWDLTLHFCLIGNNYEDLIDKMDDMETIIVPNTSYVLKIDRTPSITKNYNVKRIVPIQWENGYRLKFQRGNIIFKCNSW